ncbi:hypothetical protein [Pseudonocardia sp. HH130630-07]|uniref:hypothetical protein n=1 Tax=Pseudonocardia sp. HH130630-07 TaxID=1690815 RepID=UPI0008151393|nr:hypothetical protein [Pseudonocardia sp. HH130630-07]ANY05438.1 hypothetical protein AFB00_02960 [Pseudonocardia sp. HH130630-07]
MNVDADDHTAPILDRAQVAELRRAEHRRTEVEPAPPPEDPDPATGAWLVLVVLGNVVVLVMLALMFLLG